VRIVLTKTVGRYAFIDNIEEVIAQESPYYSDNSYNSDDNSDKDLEAEFNTQLALLQRGEE
jgi:hypothetical protein